MPNGRSFLTGLTKGIQTGMKTRREEESELSSWLMRTMLKEKMTPKKWTPETREEAESFEEFKAGLKAKEKRIKEEEKERKITGAESKKIQQTLMREYLGHQMSLAAQEETRLEKILPGRQSKYERIRSAFAGHKDYMVGKKMNIKKLFKDIGVTKDDWKSWIMLNYPGLETRAFPLEEKLKGFRRE